MTLKLKQTEKDSFGSQFIEIFRIIDTLSKKNIKGHEVVLDFSELKFIHSSYILGLSAIVEHIEEEGGKVVMQHNDTDVWKYLKILNFHKGGLKPDSSKQWKQKLTQYSTRSYLPIINFPAGEIAKETKIRDQMLSQVNQVLNRIMSGNSKCKTVLGYLLSEMTDNIVEHSGRPRGLLTAQFYKHQHFLDICILDRGKGLLESYRDNNYFKVKDDKLAIQKALEGVSTKKNNERGYGIRTSRSMIVDGLKGDFVLITGKGMLANNNIADLPSRWYGTILALRIKKPKSNFNIYKYVD